MDTSPRHGDLEITEDSGFQRREWRWQLTGRVVVFLVVGAALCGLTGDGPLSRTVISTRDGACRLEFDRFLRYENRAKLVVEWRPVPETSTSTIEISFDDLRNIEFRQITPEPEQSQCRDNTLQFVFAHPPDGGATRAVLHFDPVARGRLNVAVAVDNGETLRFQQFVYP